MPKSSSTSQTVGHVASSGVSGAADEATPLDRDDFLAQNRRNREQLREVAEEKARRKAGRDEAAQAEDRTPGRIPAARRFTVRGSRGVLVTLVALSAAVAILAATTGYFAYTSGHARSDADAAGVSTGYREQAMDSARRYAVELTTYDPANYGDLDRRIRAISTPSFANRYIASSRDARQGNSAAGGTSRAQATEAGVQSISDDQAVVLVALDQTITSPQVTSQVPEGIPYQSRVKITLVHRDGRWQLDDLAAV